MKRELASKNSSPVISGFRYRIIQSLIWLHILWIALTRYHNPVSVIRVMHRLIKKRDRFKGSLFLKKCIKADKRYFFDLNAPGWPSPAFRDFIKNELNMVLPFKEDKNKLLSLIWSITKKCPLNCRHCYDWQNINREEVLSLTDLKNIQKKIIDHGITQVQLSGGEPLSRFEATRDLIHSDSTGVDFWILTSGYGLTFDRARQLKQAGITGVSISLDHWDEREHNKFRGNKKSFYWVKTAAENAGKNGIAVALTLCAVKDFVTEENLRRYFSLAAGLAAGFVQILEPRAVGHFKGMDVELGKQQQDILTRFYLAVNSDPSFRHLPVAMYHAYHQRKYGCFGAGSRYLYIDSDGDAHACPFCQDKIGSILKNPVNSVLAKLQSAGCHKYKINQVD